jgi:hypothetical protein
MAVAPPSTSSAVKTAFQDILITHSTIGAGSRFGKDAELCRLNAA